MAEPDADETRENIRRARQAPGRPADFPDLSFPSLQALLEERAAELGEGRYRLDLDDGTGERAELSDREFAGHVARAAGTPAALGVRRGATITTIVHNHWQSVARYFTCRASGARVTPLVAPDLRNDSEKYRTECLEDGSFKIDNAEARWMLVGSEYRERPEAPIDRCPRLETQIGAKK